MRARIARSATRWTATPTPSPGDARPSRRARLPGRRDRERLHAHAGLAHRPDHPWVRWARASMEKSLGKRVQVIPNSSGGLPGDVFVDHLGVPLVWIPHSYNGCKQHGPDEHLLIAPAREGHPGLRRHLVGPRRAWHALTACARRYVSSRCRAAAAMPRYRRGAGWPVAAESRRADERTHEDAQDDDGGPGRGADGRHAGLPLARPRPARPRAARAWPGPGAPASTRPRARPGFAMGEAFARADANNDGRVTREEGWSGSGPLRRDGRQPRRRRDDRGDARLLRRARPGGRRGPPEMRERMQERGQAMFRVLDVNGDGRVTFEEMRPMAEAAFRAATATPTARCRATNCGAVVRKGVATGRCRVRLPSRVPRPSRRSLRADQPDAAAMREAAASSISEGRRGSAATGRNPQR